MGEVLLEARQQQVFPGASRLVSDWRVLVPLLSPPLRTAPPLRQLTVLLLLHLMDPQLPRLPPGLSQCLFLLAGA